MPVNIGLVILGIVLLIVGIITMSKSPDEIIYWLGIGIAIVGGVILIVIGLRALGARI